MKIGILNIYELINFVRFKNPVLNFLNFLSSWTLPSYKTLSYKKTCIGLRENVVYHHSLRVYKMNKLQKIWQERK